MLDTVEILGVTTVIFGTTALFLISRARSKLTDGSIKNYLGNFEVCLAFIVIFSIWQTVRSIFKINIDIGGFSTYPEYIFLIFAYVGFVIASYRVLKISDEFGFKEDGTKIRQIMSQSKEDYGLQKKEIAESKTPKAKYRKKRKKSGR